MYADVKEPAGASIVLPCGLVFRVSSSLPNSKNGRCLLAFLLSLTAAIPRRLLFAELLEGVGVAGFEPATLRLSSACSNQLSYTPG